MVLHLLTNKESLLSPLMQGLASAHESVTTCNTCGNLDTVNPCRICSDARRDVSIICVVEEVADVWAMERSGIYKGLYHVLGGTLSAMDGRGPDKLRIAPLVDRAACEEVKEIIMATNATVEGQTTAHFVAARLNDCNVSISRLAQGIPIGGELDYLDDGTLGAALKARLVV
jgi:recombination protein RecR